MFNYSLSDLLKVKINRLIRKDKSKSEILYKKIKEIVNSDIDSIKHYKNLKYELKQLKRVHIDKHFVLVFKVDIENNFILFLDFNHHDKIYKS